MREVSITTLILSLALVLSACGAPSPHGSVLHVTLAKGECPPTKSVKDCLGDKLKGVKAPDRLYLATGNHDVSAFLFWANETDGTAAAAQWNRDNDNKVTHYSVPAKTSGPASGTALAGQAIVSVVNVPSPWYAPDFLVAGRMRDAVPDYAIIAGLDYKYFTQSDKGMLGGVYLWQNQQAANAFYDKKWHDRILESYGQPASLEFFEVTELMFIGPDMGHAP